MGMWLQTLPGCFQGNQALADFTPHNLRLVPLPPGSVPEWPSQGLDLPRTLIKFYGEDMAERLTFVVLLREPLRLLQSAYYHRKAIDLLPQGDTFLDSLRQQLAAARGDPARYSESGIWPGMYGWHLQAFLEHFKPSQFLIIPMAFLDKNSSGLCAELSERLPSLDLNACSTWGKRDDNSHEHPPLTEDIPLEEQVDFEEFMAADHERLLEVLSEAHLRGLGLFGFSDAAGSRSHVDMWLRSNWI